MKKYILAFCFFCTIQTVYSQDTVRVKAFDYSSITRDTFIDFPSGEDSYRKIVMLYNMRCKGARVSTGANRNLGCGEWDYSCNTYIEDSTRTDSLLATTPEYTIDGFNGTTFNYTETPTYNYYRNTSIKTTVNSSINVQSTQVDNGTNFTAQGITGTLAGQPARIQHLYTARELLAAGLVAGNVWSIQVVTQNNLTVSDLRINIQSVDDDTITLSNVQLIDFTNVFTGVQEFVAGDNEITFHKGYEWDGVSNILIEFTSAQSISFEELLVMGTEQDTSRSIAALGRDYLLLNGTNYAESDGYAGVLGSQNRTCEAWIKTEGVNQEIVSWGRDATSQKWVFRTNSDGTLRVEVNGGGANATTPVNDGKWHHVACVLDGDNVTDIKLYVDGVLETISAASNIGINTAANINLRVSRGINNRYFVGGIDDVRIWDIALSQAEIQGLMRRKSLSTDDNWNNLKAYFRFEDMGGNFTKDESATGSDISITGQEQNGKFRSTTLFKDFQYTKNRLNIRWKIGDFVVTNDTSYTFDQLEQPSNLVTKFSINRQYNTVNSDLIEAVESIERWNSDKGEIYYDEFGEVLETKSVIAAGSLTPSTLPYTRRWPSRLEIMSFVTPYGIGLDLGSDGKTWTFDMTDFTPILKEKKRIFLSRGGQNQEEMDIEFLFIKGTPPRDVLDIREIWPSQQLQANFTQIQNNTYFPPIDFDYDASAKGLKLRSAITGHGQQGEFIPRDHTYTVNGTNFVRNVWKECADNPIYPQGGTWIYDRAGWCPGMATDVAEYDISKFMNESEKVNIDYTVNSGEGDSRYIISSQVVTYGEYNHKIDAGITDILAPSNKVEYARDNPMCSTPTIEITNYGSETLKDAVIEYWVNDESNKKEITWYGDILPSESAIFYLPVEQEIWTSANATNNTFHARIKMVNSQEDEDASNNEYISTFDIPKVFPTSFYLFTRTNNAGNETKITIKDIWGTVVFSKDNFGANEIYRDTIVLGLGCYNLTIEDSDDDGLSFFANNDGSGFFRVMQLGTGIIQNFENDFGKRNTIKFTVQHPLSVEDQILDLGLKCFPNPTSGLFTLEGYDLSGAQCTILNSLGQEIYAKKMDIIGKQQLDITGNPSGLYFVKVEYKGNTWTQRILLSN